MALHINRTLTTTGFRQALLDIYDDLAQINPAAIELEKGCYDATVHECNEQGIICDFAEPGFRGRYSSHSYKILANLNDRLVVDTSNFVTMLRNRESSLIKIATMTSKEICPIAAAEERAIIEERKQQKIEKKISTLFKCAKCGANRSTKEEKFLRSNDEASTFKHTCEGCGHTWVTQG